MLREEEGGIVIPTIKEEFEKATKRKYPYYQVVGGKYKHFALCPRCQNPVTIVGFYKKK